MISDLNSRVRRWRRKFNRTRISARLLGLDIPGGEAEEPGVIQIQIDGLSRTQFEKALGDGRMPFLARMMKRRHFHLESFYSGVPSTTPAVQAEIFYQVRQAVPAFQFFDRGSGVVRQMFDVESAAKVTKDLEEQCPTPLFSGGTAYSNIYRGGADFSRYCFEDLGPDTIFKNAHPLAWLVLPVLYAPRFLRMIGLGLLEVVIAFTDAIGGLFQRRSLGKELGFVPVRVLVCILLREAVRYRMLLDIDRGVRVIQGNFLGYDEQSHRRGPSSRFALWSLKGIDDCIRDLVRAAGGNDYRDYEIIVHSDHGQERVTYYGKVHGKDPRTALAEVFASGPLAGSPVWSRGVAEHLGASGRGQRRDRTPRPEPPDPARHIIVTAMGPLGHIYLPAILEKAELETYARRLVAEAGIPIVLVRGAADTAEVWNARGRWELPRDHREVLGHRHPFGEETARDLAALAHHRDAGELVFCGWNPDGDSLTFALENGAHGGPGAEETRGFLLVPDRIFRWHRSHLPPTGTRVRGEDLHRIVAHFLGRETAPLEFPLVLLPEASRETLRVMTYNIHSCVGTDGKLRVERIARVINQFDPDLIAVQEVDCHRLRTRHHDQAKLLADQLKMTHVFHAMFEEERERYGIAIFARFPFELVKSGFLTEANPRLLTEARGAIWVKVDFAGKSLHFINTHFGLGRDERHRQADELLGPRWLGQVPDTEPVVLCGDLNSNGRSGPYRKLRSRLLDVQREAPGHEPQPTFSSMLPLMRIDHIFVSPHFRVESVERPVTSVSRVASDHLPLGAELAWS